MIAENYLNRKVSIAPLVVFRVLFGFVMLFSILRTLTLGWFHKFYIAPTYSFKLTGFDWLPTFSPEIIYLFIVLLILSALGILLGALYRICSILFFILFSYFELLDITHYLNHYYLISLLSFILIFVPANRKYAVDVWLNPKIELDEVPYWTIFWIKFQIALLYFFAGIAKLHSDWLLNALPLKIWLSRNSDLPIVGNFLLLQITAYLFSWFGAIYDLSIAFFLYFKKTRVIAYLAVVVFHLATAMLFNIGVFPIIMIFFTTIFFSTLWHEKIISNFVLIFNLSKLKQGTSQSHFNNRAPWLFWIFISWQLLFPMRHWLYPGDVLWTEEGFRFSWKVMVVEKTGTIIFKIREADGSKESEVDNREYLTAKQEVFMSYQPDMILDFAHFLAKDFKNNKGFKEPIVTADCFVSLNGRPARRFIKPDINLAKQPKGFCHKDWIILYDDI
jgi:hypothetical protein